MWRMWFIFMGQSGHCRGISCLIFFLRKCLDFSKAEMDCAWQVATNLNVNVIGTVPPGNACLGCVFGQMLSALLSREVICCTSPCVDWWCTSRETAERPLQARSSRVAMSTCPNAWTSSSVTSCRSCRESWVNWSLVLKPFAACLSVTWLLGVTFYSCWSVIAGERSDTFSRMCHFRI